MRLGFTQRAVLTSMADEPCSARHVAYDWPWISESAARSAINRLGARSLVDVAGWDSYGGRTYQATTKGLEALDAAGQLDEDDA